MKPDYKLRIKPKSSARSIVRTDTIAERNKQLDEAVSGARNTISEAGLRVTAVYSL